MQREPSIERLMDEAVHHARKALDQAVRAHGVSLSQWAVLQQLADRPGLSGAELAREMLLTPQGVHQVLTTLQWMGLVERTPDPHHARIFRADLTDEGRRTAEGCRADVEKVRQALLEPFDDDEQAAFAALLGRFLDRARDCAG
jgi:DNA-binding MarR family transcriptional regulator